MIDSHTLCLDFPFLTANASDFLPQQLANTAWAFAAAGVEDDQVFNVISDQVDLKRDQVF